MKRWGHPSLREAPRGSISPLQLLRSDPGGFGASSVPPGGLPAPQICGKTVGEESTRGVCRMLRGVTERFDIINSLVPVPCRF